MSQLQAGAVPVHKTETDVADICLTCIEHVQIKAKEKQQTCKVELIPVDAEFIVLTDSSQVQVINGNLLENTVKYGLLSDIISI